MSESKQKPIMEKVAAPATAPVMNPTKASEVEDLPQDAVALLVWRKFTGPQPMTIVVTKASWEMNRRVVIDAGFVFVPERVYEFDSPTNPAGRRTTFMLQDVIGWAANFHSSIIVPPSGLKV